MDFKNSNSGKREESIETFESGPRNDSITRDVLISRKARKIKFDSHVHLDGPFSEGAARHGLTPAELINELVESPDTVDILAITNHNNVDREGRQEVVDKIRGRTHKNIEILLGTELNLRYQDRTFHVNVIFKDASTDYEAPESRQITLEQLQELKENYNVVIILNHPFWRAKSKNAEQTYQIITSLLETRVIDGYEMLHGSYLRNFTERRSSEKLINMDDSKRLHNIQSTIKCFIDFVLNNPGKKLAAIGSSDIHRPGAIGSAYTSYFGSNASLFSSIRAGKTKAVAEGQKIAVLIQRCLRSMNLNKREKSVFHKSIELDRINYALIKKKAEEDKRRGRANVKRKKRGRYRNSAVSRRKKRNSS